MANFLQLNDPNILNQTRNMSWGQALQTENPFSKNYQGYNPSYKGADKTSLKGYAKQGLESLKGNFLKGSNVGGATPLTRKLALMAMDYAPKVLGVASKFLGPASFFFDSTAMGNAELPEGYDADQEYFDYYNKYGDNYGDLKIPGSNWRQRLMNQKIQQQKKEIGMPQHLTYTPPTPTPKYSGPVTHDFDPKQDTGRRPDKPGGFTDPGKGSYGPHMAYGGRASYFDGGLASLWLR